MPNVSSGLLVTEQYGLLSVSPCVRTAESLTVFLLLSLFFLQVFRLCLCSFPLSVSAHHTLLAHVLYVKYV